MTPDAPKNPWPLSQHHHSQETLDSRPEKHANKAFAGTDPTIITESPTYTVRSPTLGYDAAL